MLVSNDWLYTYICVHKYIYTHTHTHTHTHTDVYVCILMHFLRSVLVTKSNGIAIKFH
jgi:hypothetical protein